MNELNILCIIKTDGDGVAKDLRVERSQFLVSVILLHNKFKASFFKEFSFSFLNIYLFEEREREHTSRGRGRERERERERENPKLSEQSLMQGSNSRTVRS